MCCIESVFIKSGCGVILVPTHAPLSSFRGLQVAETFSPADDGSMLAKFQTHLAPITLDSGGEDDGGVALCLMRGSSSHNREAKPPLLLV